MILMFSLLILLVWFPLKIDLDIWIRYHNCIKPFIADSHFGIGLKRRSSPIFSPSAHGEMNLSLVVLFFSFSVHFEDFPLSGTSDFSRHLSPCNRLTSKLIYIYIYFTKLNLIIISGSWEIINGPYGNKNYFLRRIPPAPILLLV